MNRSSSHSVVDHGCAGRPPRTLLAAVACALVTPGCVTAAMWEELDDSRRERVARVALAPVTVAVDVGMVAGYCYALVHAHGCRSEYEPHWRSGCR